MGTFDRSEYERWVRTARDNLRVASHDAGGGFYHAAVFHAEQAAQCALKGLLHAVGAGRHAREHGLLSLARACADAAGLVVGEEHREALADLARQYQTTRYPDALPEGTPAEHYGPGSAERAIAAAEALLAAVEAAWAALERAAGGGEPP